MRILIRIPRSEGVAWGPQHSGLSTVPTTRHPVEVATARLEQVGLGFPRADFSRPRPAKLRDMS